jgi:hypothetical protein
MIEKNTTKVEYIVQFKASTFEPWENSLKVFKHLASAVLDMEQSLAKFPNQKLRIIKVETSVVDLDEKI